MNILQTSVAETMECDGVHSVTLPRPAHFDINKIFDCGQCFRYDKTPDGGYEGVAHGRYIKLLQSETEITVLNCTTDEFYSIWYKYLALDEDYDEINRDIAMHFGDDGVIRRAMLCGDGIRILRQELWETLVSFIISQNNNIPRIKKIISTLCREYGDEIYFRGAAYYTFPSPEAVLRAGEEGIFALKTGFRAKYIIDAAEKYISGLTDGAVLDASFEDGAEALRRIRGVGDKVASCVMLFSCHRTDAFPIDVWIKKVMDKYYAHGLDITSLGRYAGVAQQYLFYMERYNNNDT